jgi:hypothetical protein
LAGFLGNGAFAANISIPSVFFGVRLVLETVRPYVMDQGDMSDP